MQPATAAWSDGCCRDVPTDADGMATPASMAHLRVAEGRVGGPRHHRHNQLVQAAAAGPLGWRLLPLAATLVLQAGALQRFRHQRLPAGWLCARSLAISAASVWAMQARSRLQEFHEPQPLETQSSTSTRKNSSIRCAFRQQCFLVTLAAPKQLTERMLPSAQGATDRTTSTSLGSFLPAPDAEGFRPRASASARLPMAVEKLPGRPVAAELCRKWPGSAPLSVTRMSTVTSLRSAGCTCNKVTSE